MSPATVSLPQATSSAVPLNLRAIGGQIAAALLKHSDRGVAIFELTEYARRITNGLFAVFLSRNEHGRLFAAMQSLPREEPSLPHDVLQRLQLCGELACENQQAGIEPLSDELTLVSVPIDSNEALCVALLLRGASVEPFLLTLQLLAALMPFVNRHVEQHEAAWEADAIAMTLDLVCRLATARDLKSGCRMLVDLLPRCVPYPRVAIGVMRPGGACRLIAITGMHDFDRRAELPRALETALRQAASRTTVESVESKECGLQVTAPLRTTTGQEVGALVLFGKEDQREDARTTRYVAAASEAIAAGLMGLRQHRWPLAFYAAPVKPRVNHGHSRWSWRKASLALLVLGALSAMALPSNYRISCECQLQPATRRYVAAPFAGVLEKSLAEPGDIVAVDQVLGLMDGKEIRWELASVAADQQRAGKSYDVNLAAGKVAAAQIDRLEIERLEQKRRLLEHRAAHLEIRSPIDGVLLSGDLKRSEGVPLTLGQRLYEVAPLADMVVEVMIDDEDVPLVEIGQSVEIRLNATGGQRHEGRLQRIHPRSEVRDNENVFIGEVVLANEGSLLRPGMKGEATVVAAPQRLGWILFHSGWNKLTNWLRW